MEHLWERECGAQGISICLLSSFIWSSLELKDGDDLGVPSGELPGFGHLQLPWECAKVCTKTFLHIFPSPEEPSEEYSNSNAFRGGIFAFHRRIFGFGFEISDPDSSSFFPFPSIPVCIPWSAFGDTNSPGADFIKCPVMEYLGWKSLSDQQTQPFPSTAEATPNPCPQVPHPHSQDGNSSASLGSLFQENIFQACKKWSQIVGLFLFLAERWGS